MQWKKCSHFKTSKVRTRQILVVVVTMVFIYLYMRGPLTHLLLRPIYDLLHSDAQREKFNQLYRISDSTDFEDSVIRLVNLVQNCLYIFGLFKLSDVDGLLCNATETGLDAFYNTFLSSKFQVNRKSLGFFFFFFEARCSFNDNDMELYLTMRIYIFMLLEIRFSRQCFGSKCSGRHV